MRLKIINLFAINQIFSMIRPTLSSTLLSFGRKSVSEEYNRLRNASVYRGTIFALSATKKQKICEDIYGPQFYEKLKTETVVDLTGKKIRPRLVSDQFVPTTIRNKPRYPVSVRNLQIDLQSEQRQDLSFKCVGRNFQKRNRQLPECYFIGSAFQPKFFYSMERIDGILDYAIFSLLHFIGLSSEYVPHNREKVEKRYMNIRRTLKVLTDESSEYTDQINTNDDLSTLSRLQKFILCASILFTPAYRGERLEFSFEWMRETEDTLDYVQKSIYFRRIRYEPVSANCILCKAFEDGTKRNSNSVNLYITKSYDDGCSVIVLKEENDGRIFIDKYFQSIPILMLNLQGQMDFGELFSNFKPED